MAKCGCNHYLIQREYGYSFTRERCLSHLLALKSISVIGSYPEVMNELKGIGCVERLEVHLRAMHDMPSALPDCKHLVLRTDHLMYFGDFPEALLRIPSLEALNVSASIIFTRIPPSLRATDISLVCNEVPYWLMNTRFTVPCFVLGRGTAWQRDLLNLYAPILQGLQCEGPWKRWLTQGLYDPRLFALIRDFLL